MAVGCDSVTEYVSVPVMPVAMVEDDVPAATGETGTPTPPVSAVKTDKGDPSVLGLLAYADEAVTYSVILVLSAWTVTEYAPTAVTRIVPPAVVLEPTATKLQPEIVALGDVVIETEPTAYAGGAGTARSSQAPSPAASVTAAFVRRLVMSPFRETFSVFRLGSAER
jgi:hypothetical protein